MKCACGVTLEPGSQTVTCTSCGRQNFNCHACGGGISASPQAMLVRCPYCDAPLRRHDLGDQPPYYPVNLASGDARERLLRFILNRFGVPADLHRKYDVQACDQVFIPVHLFRVTANLSDSISETDTTSIVGTNDLWYEDALTNHRFAAKVKQLMDPEQLSGKIYPLDVSHKQAKRSARDFGKTLLDRDRRRFSEVQGTQRVVEESEGQVFYPFYELEYAYNGKRYRGVVDAANGVVCRAEHPMSKRSRAMVMSAGVVLTAFTLLCAAVFVILGLDEPMLFGSAAVVLLTGSASSARIFWAAVRNYASDEEVEEHRDGLDLKDLTGRFPVTGRKMLSQAPPKSPVEA